MTSSRGRKIKFSSSTYWKERPLPRSAFSKRQIATSQRTNGLVTSSTPDRMIGAKASKKSTKNPRGGIAARRRGLERRSASWRHRQHARVACLLLRLGRSTNSSTSHAPRTKTCATLSGTTATSKPCWRVAGSPCRSLPRHRPRHGISLRNARTEAIINASQTSIGRSTSS